MERVQIKPIVNRLASPKRTKLHGREYIVVPVTMIVPGVLNGSRGPLFYPAREVARNYTDWNGVPIVLGHPKEGSAKRPDVLEKYAVGTVFNARIYNTRLMADAWLDVERLRELSPKALSAVETGFRLEVSTGFTSDFVETPGSHNGRTFNARVIGIRPDHLAIFVDGERGACSCQDGCGINNGRITWDDLLAYGGGHDQKPEPLGFPPTIDEIKTPWDEYEEQRDRRREQKQSQPGPKPYPTEGMLGQPSWD